MILMYNGIPIELSGNSGPGVEESSLVRGMTKEEFDALNEGDKKGLIVVTDEESSAGDSSGSSNADIYSTEEQVIGKWIDGKTLYRRVLRGTSPSSTGVWSPIADDTFDYVNEVIQLRVMVLDHVSSWVPLPYVNGSTTMCVVLSSERKIIMRLENSGATNRPCIAFIEYTKLSDNANTLKMRPIDSLASATFEKRGVDA